MNVFSTNSTSSVSAIGELELIRRIRSWLGSANPQTPFGIGDDCAVLKKSDRQRVITTDPVIYGRHFDDSVSASNVGAKLLKRNISDVAAMGAKPTHAVLSLALGATVNLRWLEQFYRGIARESRRFGVLVVGGDIAELSDSFVATLTLIGEATAPRLLTRDGASPGDSIWVTGSLGGSILKHHYAFTPRVAEGQWLAGKAEVVSMMDLSDGLAKDVHALLPRNTQVAIRRDVVPISAAARKLSLLSGRAPLQHALCDGEDYELVFAIAAKADAARFAKAWSRNFKTRVTQIGKIVPLRQQISAECVDLKSLRAYEHLR